MDAGLLLDDFEAEARIHTEKIESAFLAPAETMSDPKIIGDVFRAAHSLKGTAGFFSFEKIVSIAHSLENVFTLLRDGGLEVTEGLTDVVLKSVDVLRELIDNLSDDEAVDISEIIDSLVEYGNMEQLARNIKAESQRRAERRGKRRPFPEDSLFAESTFASHGFFTEGMLDEITHLIKRGFSIFYVRVNFNRSLERYYKEPSSLFDNIKSIGTVVYAVAGDIGKDEESGKPTQVDDQKLIERIVAALLESDNVPLEILAMSVLDPDLFSIGTEIDEKCIEILDYNDLTGNDGEDYDYDDESQKPDSEKASQSESRGELKTDYFLRLNVSTINELMDLSNEMILVRNQLLSVVGDFKKNVPGLPPVLQDFSRLTSEIQEKVMLARMQPVEIIFSKFPRVIRDMSQKLGKGIDLVIKGEDVALDKYLLEAISDPITQLVKNAVDHGIEHEAERVAARKSRRGTITLNAYLRNGQAIVEVSDDGGGVNVDALRLKALENGVATEDEVNGFTERQLYDLMFVPGMSTAKEITDISGRGVGMDIVKINIENLGGFVEVDSFLGIGTTIRVKMPLTLSVARSLIVKIDGIEYAIPETNVVRVVKVYSNGTGIRMEHINNALVLNMRGNLFPVVSMAHITAKNSGGRVPADAGLRKKSSVKCVVLRANNCSFALLVDDAISTEETLVKPLPVYLKKCVCYSSVTVLGNGNAIMILNPDGINKFMCLEDICPNDSGVGVRHALKTTDTKQIVIFRCSGKEHFALEMSEVARIETINASDMQTLGDDEYINIHDNSIQIVRPEDYMPVQYGHYNSQKLYLIMPKENWAFAGILVRSILDSVEGEFRLDKNTINSNYVRGTSVYKDKILIFVNLPAILSDVVLEKLGKLHDAYADNDEDSDTETEKIYS